MSRIGNIATCLVLLGCGQADLDRDDNLCRVRMVDSKGEIDVTLQVKTLTPDSQFIVTDRIDTSDPWSVEVTVEPDGQLVVSADVPELTRDELLASYAMHDDQQVSFTPLSGYTCGELERALIYFLVWEWFYYG